MNCLQLAVAVAQHRGHAMPKPMLYSSTPSMADEFIAAYRREGEAMKKRDDTHRMAEANKAFAHFAW